MSRNHLRHLLPGAATIVIVASALAIVGLDSDPIPTRRADTTLELTNAVLSKGGRTSRLASITQERPLAPEPVGGSPIHGVLFLAVAVATLPVLILVSNGRRSAAASAPRLDGYSKLQRPELQWSWKSTGSIPNHSIVAHGSTVLRRRRR